MELAKRGGMSQIPTQHIQVYGGEFYQLNMPLFFSNMRFKVGCGQKILFWLGLWVGDSSWAPKYPRLFSCAIDKNAKVSSYFSRVGSSFVWAPIFRRNLPEEEDVQLLSMLVELEAVYIPVFGKDRRVWSVSTDGSFCLFFLSESSTEALCW